MSRLKPGGRTGASELFRNLALVAVFLLRGVFSSSGNSFDLSGNVECQFFNTDGTVSSSESQHFRMLTDGTRYIVRLESPGRSFDTDYYEVAFDGTNSYYVAAFPTWVKQQRAISAEIGTNIATGCISRVPVPQFEFTPAVAVLWCAYISGSLLRGQSQMTEMNSPFTRGVKSGANTSPNDFFRLPVIWSNHQGRGFFPEVLAFLDKREAEGAQKSKLGRSMTNSLFKTLEWTNIAEIDLPKAASATSFAASESSVRKVAEYEFRIENASAVQGVPNFQPTLPGFAVITEERFNDPTLKEMHFMYMTEKWISESEALKNPGYRRAALAVRSTPSASTQPSLTNKILFCILIILPLVLIWRVRSAKRFQNEIKA